MERTTRTCKYIVIILPYMYMLLVIVKLGKKECVAVTRVVIRL